MSTKIFRNLKITPDAPVEQWGVEGILAAIDRGAIGLWRRIAEAVRRDPYGDVAADLEQALTGAESESSAAVLRLVLERARETSEQRVARRIREAVARTGLTQADFATRLGTSASRLSTYATGTVVPSAVLLDRAEHLADKITADQERVLGDHGLAARISDE